MGDKGCGILACSQVGAEAICRHSICKAGNASGMSNGKNTRGEHSRKDKKKAISTKPQSSEILTASSSRVRLGNTRELLTWLQAASHAKVFPSRGQEKQTVMPGINGQPLLAVLKSSDQNTPSSKTSMDSLAQKLQKKSNSKNQKRLKSKTTTEKQWYKPMPDLFGTWQLYCETLPPSGMTRGTKLYQLPMSERPISVSGGGVLQKSVGGGVSWPTPAATDDTERSADNIVLNSNGTPRYKTNSGGLSQARLPESVKAFEEKKIKFPTPKSNDCKKGSNCDPLNPRNGLQGFINKKPDHEMFPTPVASDGTTGHIIGENDTFKTLKSGAIRKINQKGTDGSVGLGRYVRLFPTPQQSNFSGGKSQSANGLATAALKFPTPRSSEYKDSGPVGSKSHTHMLGKSYLCAKVKERDLPAGKLNPDWVCWLMGWPIGWASLEKVDKEIVNDWKTKTLAGAWWQEEPEGIPRVKTYTGKKGKDSSNARRQGAIKALGNGQVPLTAFAAKQILLKKGS